MAEDDAITANDIGEAIRRGVALLEQQSVPAPTFKLRRVLDVYEEGIRAAKSRAPANRIRQAWLDAAGELPPPMPATVERALEESGDESTVALGAEDAQYQWQTSETPTQRLAICDTI